MKKQQFQHPRDSAPLLLAALLALAPTSSGAFVLGEPVPLSKIGEPLKIEIPVLQGDPAQLGECLRLAALPASSDGLPRVRNARLDFAGRGSNVRLVLSHRLPSFDPALRFAIEDLCDSRLRREYTVLLAFPDNSTADASAGSAASTQSGDTAADAPPQETPRRPRHYRRAASSADAPVATSTAAPGRATAPSSASRDRLELGGGESEIPGSGLRLSTQLGSLARIDATTEARREQLRREQSVIMAIDRTIVAQLELDERIRQLEAVQSRMMAEHIRTPAAASRTEPAVPATEPADAEPPAPQAQPAEPDHSVAEAWKQGTLTVGFVSLALAAVLAWIRKRRDKAPAADETEPARRTAPARKKAPLRPPAPPTDPAARPASPVAAAHPAAPVLPPDLPETTASGRPPVHSPFGWETEEDIFAPPVSIAPIAPIAPLVPTSHVAVEESAEEHESAIELAEIMMGFGRIRGAADTLAEFIASNPKKAVTPWLKLMEVYRTADLREEFDALAKQLNKTFNVKTVTWESFDEARTTTNSMEQMAHVTTNVQQMWGTRECQAYLEHLLRDNRDGTREGFPLSVIDEILLLELLLEDQLGPYRPEITPPPDGDASRATPPQLV
ncbi:hypothetical protein LLG90_07030 [Aromatoleum toluclasticum]|uniref:type IV pilus assembly protein FimV n=1 Tax=Aromatoleum toluclasticum TaxID=92003 RepID=UPI001D17F9DB|nr:hypothetical protein [Aromatoleum toluclasticum]MCC4115101.1 hypothetical protein [Aromatoleum toluclasticum]